MISLAGKAALITGGSRGIGAAAVKLFAQAGADVVFNYNKAKDAAAQIEAEARKHGTRVEAFKADVSKHADSVHLEGIAVKVGTEWIGGSAPNASFVSLHWQRICRAFDGDRDLLGVGSAEAEDDAVVGVHFRRNDRRRRR